jgi:hypothetical protein
MASDVYCGASLDQLDIHDGGGMRRLYLLLAILGFILPYYFFVSFLIENGLDLGLLLGQLFANDISAFFAVDLIITAIVLLAFMVREAGRYQMRNRWLYIVATLAVGPSFAFPLFLYFREAGVDALASKPA